MELEKRKGKPFWKILRSLGFSAEQVHSLDVEKMMVVPTILRDLGVNSGIFLLADSAGKLRACRKAGIEVKEVLSTGALSPVW
jgi:GTP cyclohydrolase II